MERRNGARLDNVMEECGVVAAVQIAIPVPFNIYRAWLMYQGVADEKIRYDGFAVCWKGLCAILPLPAGPS